MGSKTMLREVVILLLLISALPAHAVFAQTELAGSWAAVNHEDLAGDGIPVDYTGMPLNEEARTRMTTCSSSAVGAG